MPITEKLTNINLFHKYGSHYLKLDTSQLKLVSDFNKKIISKLIPFEEVPCLCGNNIFALIASIDCYGFFQSTVICKKCGLIQSNPRVKTEYYRFFYESDEYRRLYDGDNFIACYESFYHDGRGDKIFDRIVNYRNLETIKSVLEIGAAGG